MAKKNISDAAAIAIAGVKGGIGKTTISQNIAPLLVDSQFVKIIEIDNNNNSLLSISESKRVCGISLKASGSDLEKAVDEAVLATLGEGVSVILDFGGGDDSIRAMGAVGKEVPNLEVWIPLTPDFETVANAIATTNSVPYGIKKVLVFSNFSDLKDDYWFIFGSSDFGIESNLSIFNYFDETIEVPRSRLFGLAKLYRTTLWDLSDISNSYDYSVARMEWVKLPREDFAKQMNRHRLSVAATEFLEAVMSSRRDTRSWI